ncbi:hypothetical protein ACFB49_33350 [Sphingomonas sp. DBB INV C78]|uniref:hypothetical protein n=1 Tax=Sphingomonas sp. DBB INV C78 TaxID=3349434 RepID=UPI0036D40422
MINSAIMCRQQETLHRQIAMDAGLQNVRRVALAAAAAWALAAEDAEARDAGSGCILNEADAAIALEFKLEDDRDEDPGKEAMGNHASATSGAILVRVTAPDGARV